MKHCQLQKISSTVAIETRNIDCGLKFRPVKVYNGLESRTTVLLLNISAILK